MKYIAIIIGSATHVLAWNQPHGLFEDIGYEMRKLEKCKDVDSSVSHYVQTMVDAQNYIPGIKTVVEELRGRIEACTFEYESPNYFYACHED